MPTVLVDLERTKHPHCGLGQYCLRLGASLLDAAAADEQYEFLLPPGHCFASERSPIPKAHWARPWQKDRVVDLLRPLLRPLANPSYDVWHATHQDSHYFPLDDRIPLLLTLHDLNFLREKPAASFPRRLAKLQRILDRAAAVTTGSQFAADEIRTYLHLRDKPIHVIPHGVTVDTEPRHQAAPPFLAPDARFFFSLGVALPKKNFHVLVELLPHFPQHRLVIAGANQTAYAEQIRRRAESLGVGSRVLLPGTVSNAVRHWLYAHCEAFLFPSLAEGFGLPVIEALAFGKPTVLSLATSLPEVGGPYAEYFDDDAPAEMAAVVRRALAANQPHDIARRKAHAATFTWRRAADAYRALYRELAGAAQHPRRAA